MGAADHKKLAYSGILLSLLIILLFLRSIIPINQLSLYIFSSFIVGIVLIENGLKFSVIFYFASVILALILPIEKLSLLIYFSFFGIYGIIKYIIEKIKNRVIVLIIKIIYFTAVLYINYLFASFFIPVFNKADISIYVMVPFAIAAFIVYDLIYSLFAEFYISKIHKFLWRRK